MHRKVSDIAVIQRPFAGASLEYRFELGAGKYPYFGKTLHQGLRQVDDYNIDGIHLLISNGSPARSQKNTFIVHLVCGKAYVDETFVVLSCSDEQQAFFLKRVLENTDVEGILLDFFSPRCHLDFGKLQGIEFYMPGKGELEILNRAYQNMESEKRLLQKQDEIFQCLMSCCYKDCFFRDDNDSSKDFRLFSEVALLLMGRDLTFDQRRKGLVPIVSSFGVVGEHDQALASAPAIIIGLKGSRVDVQWIDDPSWPAGNVLYLDDASSELALPLIYFCLLDYFACHNNEKFTGDIEALKAVVNEISVPVGGTLFSDYGRVAKLVLRRFDLSRKKQKMLDRIKNDYLDLVATGLKKPCF